MSRWKPCGVCTETSCERCGVLMTKLSLSMTLIVFFSGTAAIAPPYNLAASTTLSIVLTSINGRAASCTSIISQSVGTSLSAFAIEY